MPLRRLTATVTAMTGFAVGLDSVTPAPAALLTALVSPQSTADTAGADAVLLAWCALAAWLFWSWGALGLALTAASALPGTTAAFARTALRALLPADARRAAALALGLGLGVGSPWLAVAAPPPASPSTSAPVPDWPAQAPDGAYVVVRGDCLWLIAEGRLTGSSGRWPTDREVLDAVHSWWSANAEVIGPDPDLLLPGQVLRPPGTA